MGDSDRKNQLQNSSAEEYRLIPVEQGYYVEEDEKFIDIVGIIRDLWDNRRTIFRTFLVVLVIGVLVFIVSERMYYAEASLMPEAERQSQVSQLMQRYGGLFGITQNANDGSELGVTLYPQIVKSRLFLIELLQTTVYFDQYDREMTLFEYFHEVRQPSLWDRSRDLIWDATFGFPATLQRWFSSGNGDAGHSNDFSIYSNLEEPVKLDADIRAATDAVSNWITVYIEPQTGFIVIGASMPDASAAAGVVQEVMVRLQQEIIEYRTEKANQDLQGVRQEFLRISDEYFSMQDSLARYEDTNRNLATAGAQVTLSRMRNETRRLESLYNSIITQLESAEMSVREETPVFREHEPAFIPGRPSSPDLTRILLGSIFVGVFLGIALIYGRRVWSWFYSDFQQRGNGGRQVTES